MKSFTTLCLLSSVALLAACSGIESEAKYPTGADRASTGGNNIYSEAPSILGGSGMQVFNSRDKKSEDNGIGVNSHLWRAALDTVSFMPLASADPFGGTIITDWYTATDTPNERTKLNVFIMGSELKADALSVKVFRQVKGNGGWTDVPVAKETATKLEDAILTRAREMKIAKQ